MDRIVNIAQNTTLVLCFVAAAWLAIRKRDRAWTLLAFFFGCFALGDLYWMSCVLFYGETPTITVVSSLSWYATYIFLYMTLRQLAPPESARETRVLPWLGFAFTLAMGIFYFALYIVWQIELGEKYVLWGKALDNLIVALLMGLLLFSAIRRLMDRDKYPTQRYFCIVVLVFCLLEYALWTASCFWWTDTLGNPYYWFDFLLTANFFFFLPATKKAVAA